MPGGFNLNDYETVDTRIARFWADHPDGRILPEMTFDDGARTVFRVEVYTDREDTRPAAIGHATETVSNSGVNKTSALENCETSAIGRALANLNYATSGRRASREEMSKTEQARAAHAAQNGQGNGQPEETPEQRTTRYVGKLLNAATDDQVNWWITKIGEFKLGDRDVTRLVSPDVREAMGLRDDPLTANQLVERVRAYAAKHHSGPAHEPQAAPGGRDTPDPGSTTSRREPVPSAG